METKLLDCGHPVSEHESFTTGYGRDENGKTFCYACCAEGDKKYMREHGKIDLYLTFKEDENGIKRARITNWPASLVISSANGNCVTFRRGNHNIARTRCDVWFVFEGENWHGTQYGEWTEIVHCKRVK
jgi:hypothetical protein